MLLSLREVAKEPVTSHFTCSCMVMAEVQKEEKSASQLFPFQLTLEEVVLIDKLFAF